MLRVRLRPQKGHRYFWTWPWERWGGPVYYFYGLGFWSLIWSEVDGWEIEPNED